MAVRKPLVEVNGKPAELPSGDTLDITTGITIGDAIGGSPTANALLYTSGGNLANSANLTFDGDKVTRLKPTSGNFTDYKDGSTLLSYIADDGSFRTTNDINTGKYGLYGTSRLGIYGVSEIRMTSPLLNLFGVADIYTQDSATTWSMGSFGLTFSNNQGNFAFLSNFAASGTSGWKYAQSSSGGDVGSRYLTNFELTAASSSTVNENVSVYANVIDDRSIAGTCVGVKIDATGGTNTNTERIGLLIEDGHDYAIQTGTGAVSIGDIVQVTTTSTVGQINSLSTSKPQFCGLYDGSNYLTIQTASDGAVTFDAVGSGASFTFSDPVLCSDYLTVTGSINALGGIEVDGDVLIGLSGGVILVSPDFTQWRVEVDNTGNLTTTSI